MNVPRVVEELAINGYSVIPDVLDAAALATLRTKIPATFARYTEELAKYPVAREISSRTENGVTRLPFLFEPYFLNVLEHPGLLEIIDHTTGPPSILFMMHSFHVTPKDNQPGQEGWHRDYPRLVGHEMVSISVLMAVTDFSRENGCTEVVPGTHQRERPSDEFLARHATPLEAPAGSAIVMDSSLFHRGRKSNNAAPRMFLNMMFMKSYLKQQLDLPRALPASLVEQVPERTKQLLGFYTQVPAHIEEYYRPPDKRLYRPNQG
jgi:ectoine hydroxylase-related dioxygenase (phytanoyl-CoA dioxygenase family)